MKRAYTNGILLDGTEQMEPVRGKVLLTENDKITAIADASVSLDGYEVIDLHGGYLCPGLINLHVHLAGIGDVTGSIALGKSADFIVTRENPLEDLRALQHLELVVCCGRAVKNPSPKRRKEVDAPWFPDPNLCPEHRPGSLHLVQTHVGVGYRMLRVEPDEL